MHLVRRLPPLIPPRGQHIRHTALPAALWAVLVAAPVMTVVAAQEPDPPYQRHEDGVELRVGERHLRLRVCSERILRVLYAPRPDFFDRETLMIDGSPCRLVPFELSPGDGTLTLSTTGSSGVVLGARVDLGDGTVTFLDGQGRALLAEEPGGKALEAAEVQGETTFHVRARFEPFEGEAFYGLGQHQNGLMSYAGQDVDLFQHNIVASVPFLVSSRGWGLLWDNTSRTRFGDLRRPEPIPPQRLYDAEGRPGGLTGTYRQGSCTAPVAPEARPAMPAPEARPAMPAVATRVDPMIAFGAPEDRPPVTEVHQAPQPTVSAVHPALADGDACVTWEGQVESTLTGDHDFVLFGNNGIRLWIDGRLMIDSWRQGWLPWKDVARVALVQGQRVPIRVEWRRDEGQGTLRLKWKTPPGDPATSLWSEVGDGIDYYFVYGPELDRVVAGYRELTGRAPMMPRWAFGLWQSRERYQTAREFGVRGHSALLLGHVVGRRVLVLGGPGEPGPGRAQLHPLRHSLLDDRRRRLRRAAAVLPRRSQARGPGGMARARDAVVPVRHLLPVAARPRSVSLSGNVALRR